MGLSADGRCNVERATSRLVRSHGSQRPARPGGPLSFWDTNEDGPVLLSATLEAGTTEVPATLN
jgi:hypothetical protein